VKVHVSVRLQSSDYYLLEYYIIPDVGSAVSMRDRHSNLIKCSGILFNIWFGMNSSIEEPNMLAFR
jgi:hypothetical protein